MPCDTWAEQVLILDSSFYFSSGWAAFGTLLFLSLLFSLGCFWDLAFPFIVVHFGLLSGPCFSFHFCSFWAAPGTLLFLSFSTILACLFSNSNFVFPRSKICVFLVENLCSLIVVYGRKFVLHAGETINTAKLHGRKFVFHADDAINTAELYGWKFVLSDCAFRSKISSSAVRNLCSLIVLSGRKFVCSDCAFLKCILVFPRGRKFVLSDCAFRSKICSSAVQNLCFPGRKFVLPRSKICASAVKNLCSLIVVSGRKLVFRADDTSNTDELPVENLCSLIVNTGRELVLFLWKIVLSGCGYRSKTCGTFALSDCGFSSGWLVGGGSTSQRTWSNVARKAKLD